MKYLYQVIAILLLPLSMTSVFAAPPALTTSSFTKHDVSFEECQSRTREIMAKMNLEIEDHGNGTIGGFGEQSVAIVNCHLLDKTTYIQIAVSSQKEEAAQMIMSYLVNFLKASPAPKYTPSTPNNQPGYPHQ
jgi:hypothetical protein